MSRGVHMIRKRKTLIFLNICVFFILISCSSIELNYDVFRTGQIFKNYDEYKNRQIDLSNLYMLVGINEHKENRKIFIDVKNSRMYSVNNNYGSIIIKEYNLNTGKILRSNKHDIKISNSYRDIPADYNKNLLILAIPYDTEKFLFLELDSNKKNILETENSIFPWVHYKAIKLNHNNTMFTTIDTSNTINIWDIRRKKKVLSIDEFKGSIIYSDVVFSDNDEIILISVETSSDSIISVWDINSGIEIKRINLKYLDYSKYRKIPYSGNYFKVLTVGENTRYVYFYNGEYEKVFKLDLMNNELFSLNTRFDYGFPTVSILSSNSNFLVMGDYNGYLMIYDLKKNRVVKYFRAYFDREYDFVFCDDTSKKVIAFYNSKIWIWDFLSSERIYPPEQVSNITEKLENSNYLKDELSTIKEKYGSSKHTKDLPLISIQIVNSNIEEDEKKYITNVFEEQLLDTNKVRLVAKEDIELILNEMKNSLSDLYNESTQIEVGKLLFADMIIVGSVLNVDNAYIINCKLINVETGEILKIVSQKEYNIELLINSMKEISNILVSYL